MPSAEELATRAIAHAESRPPTLGEGRLICLDGLAGAGKSTAARAIADRRPGTPVIGTDDLLGGWRGLDELGGRVHALLAPLAQGQPGRWQRWDWTTSSWAEWHDVPPTPLLVLEGVGCAAPEIEHWVTTLVFLAGDRQTLLERGLARDGAAMRPEWEQFQRDERALHARDRTRERAHLVVATDVSG